MITLEQKSLIYYINPYNSLWNDFKEGVISLIRSTSLYSPSDNKSISSLEERVINWADAIPFKTYEQKLNFIGNGARALDWGVFGVVGGLQVGITVYELFNFHFLNTSLLSHIPHILRTLSRPLSGFFFSMGIIEGVFELFNISRLSKFLHRFEAKPENPLPCLQWMKEHYFTLSKEEGVLIASYIEKESPFLKNGAKSTHFDQIAEKALQIKYERLERRVTPGLAEGVAKELNSVIRNLQSSSSNTRIEAQKRANVLMNSVARQIKNKIVIHVLALASIACTLVSMIGVFVSISSGAFFILLGSAAIALMVVQFLAKKQIVNKEVDRFYKQLEELKSKAVA